MTEQEVLITLSPDGRIYFHDLPPELLPLACALFPDDPELVARQRAWEASRTVVAESRAAASAPAPPRPPDQPPTTQQPGDPS